MLTRKQFAKSLWPCVNSWYKEHSYDIGAGLVLLLLVIVWITLVVVINYEPETPCECITDIECEVTLCSHLGE